LEVIAITGLIKTSPKIISKQQFISGRQQKEKKKKANKKTTKELFKQFKLKWRRRIRLSSSIWNVYGWSWGYGRCWLRFN